jgi:hemolysin activation/secretion protein
MSYSLIGDFASSGLSGTSSTTGLDVSYPIVRELYKNLSISTSYDLKQLHNVSPSNPNDYHLDVLSLNLNANLTDDWAGGGLNNVALIATHGSVNLNGSANQANDAASANTQGYYSKWGISANRLQTITDRMSFYGSLTAQTANKNLDSSEKIYIGGANGVRAYPSSEGSGTAGYLMSAELRQRVDTQFTVSEFYDYGYVTAYRDNDYASGSGGLNSGTNPNNYALQGWGASLGWHSTQGSELKLTFARRIGTNPIANATTGLDGDGTKIINRFWLSAGIAF